MFLTFAGVGKVMNKKRHLQQPVTAGFRTNR